MSIAEKLTTVAENVPKVYDAGYFKGQRDGWEEGNAEGWINGRAEFYNEFWDSYDTITNFVALFAGRMWNDTTFKPKNDIVAKNQANMMFYNNACTNIKQSLIDSGVSLDLSQATQANQTFCFCRTTELPKIDLSNATSLNATFQSATQLVSIDGLVLKEGVNFANTFSDLPNLENITIYGWISGSGFDIHWSTKLSADSLESIIESLDDGAYGKTITLPITAQSNYEAAYGEHSWAFLVSTKPNWTINYM